jgi:hypothetical protein
MEVRRLSPTVYLISYAMHRRMVAKDHPATGGEMAEEKKRRREEDTTTEQIEEAHTTQAAILAPACSS